ncbi:MAG: anaerobic sulfatase maturase, partial [Phycisphaerae bacterium]
MTETDTHSESANLPPLCQPFNIMCKPKCGVCNLDCEYCYYTMKPEELYPGEEGFTMSEELLEEYVKQYTEAQPQRCDFGWQGGEPTLIGLDFFRKAVELQEKYKKPGQVITNALQTNGTLLDDEWCDFLAEHEFLVGISIDGPAQWHDAFRKDHAGKGSYHRAWAGLERLKERGVEFNVLVTLNSVNAPHAGDIYRYFTNRGINYLQFIPILERTPDGKPTDFSCTPEQFGRFMLDVFEIWAARDVGRVSERYIDAIIHQIIYNTSAMCCFAERCANAHILEFNGDLYVCDHFVFKHWKIGNITEKPLAELVRDEKLEEFA